MQVHVPAWGRSGFARLGSGRDAEVGAAGHLAVVYLEVQRAPAKSTWAGRDAGRWLMAALLEFGVDLGCALADDCALDAPFTMAQESRPKCASLVFN